MSCAEADTPTTEIRQTPFGFSGMTSDDCRTTGGMFSPLFRRPTERHGSARHVAGGWPILAAAEPLPADRRHRISPELTARPPPVPAARRTPEPAAGRVPPSRPAGWSWQARRKGQSAAHPPLKYHPSDSEMNAARANVLGRCAGAAGTAAAAAPIVTPAVAGQVAARLSQKRSSIMGSSRSTALRLRPPDTSC